MNKTQYSIFEEEFLKKENTYFKVSVIMFSFFFLLGIGLLFIKEVGIYLSSICLFITLIFPFVYFEYIKYQVKIEIDEDEIKVYLKGRYKRSFKFTEIKKDFRNVVVRINSKVTPAVISNCLIIYKDIKIYDQMEYRSYWNEEEVLIIQNKQLIEKLNKIIK